ncbi:IS5 family transposase [Gloeocapsopsis crepidinum LEGE 06123]|uniref:IS5 family transposase n=1 Tax=Gloeocapsopsis crepidinum LEGE 06123 TaxID=588587 RepID=A0ABR9V068_9CHRO|nr:IS5 family transposase [Gloeocapsopsis crepidinum]MBE9192908.1 IS5 family transposase [Gloeocapsopsis crepidinum LEGE 06123]
MTKAYRSNLTWEQWELIAELFPKAKPGGRPRKLAIYTVVNAILYVLCEGCTWRALPGDFPAWSTVYGYVWRWSKDGTWLKIHDKLYQWTRVAAGREASPSEIVVDSQSVETATMISIQVGYDAGKKIHGRKRHLSVDLLGLVLRVLVRAASVPERTGAKEVLKRVHDTGNQVNRLHTIWMDGGYRGQEFLRWVMDMFRWIVEIVLRPLERKGFVILPKRWVVERTFGWLNWCRRFTKDYERLPQTSETFIYLAMIRIMVRRLA